MLLVLTWLAVAATAAVLYFRKLYSKLKNQQVNHLPTVPLLGNSARLAFRKEHMAESLRNSYKTFPNDRIVGHYEFIKPLVLIKDPELLKNITVKDFEYFADRQAFGDIQDPIFNRNLLLLKGDEWKSMRASLTPTFTSAKIRLMVPFMLEVGDMVMDHVKSDIEKSKVGYIDVDVKDLTTRFANDIIATCVFGLKVNSLKEDNEFYRTIRQITTFSLTRILKIFGLRSFPALMKKLKVKFIPEHIGPFFSSVVLGAMKQRETNKIIRNDMIHLLMEMKKGNLKYDSTVKDESAGFATAEESDLGKKHVNTTAWKDADLVAQAVVFLFAGFETVSTTISFLLHELALHPEAQEKLVQEIRENDEKTGGVFDYNSVQNMVYLDMVISETLRKWPAVSLTDRRCLKDYNAGKPNSSATKDFIVQKGDAITIPIYSFHRDPDFFPEPEKFDPERFSPENRGIIKPYTYMPFGLGPRICIGSRFALCEVKVMVYQLVKYVEVSPCEKTPIPGQLSTGAPTLKLEGGHWLRFGMRK